MDPGSLADILLWLLAAALILLGLVGIVLPALPASPLLFAGLLVAAWAEDFHYVGTTTLILLAVLAVLSYALDVVAGAYGARRFGASPRAVSGAIVGVIVGIFFGLPGVLLGPFIGAFIGELTERPDLNAAGRAGIGASIGMLLGVAAKLALAFAMIGLFLIVRFF
jgi:uncharacterized protein YqgC (DUF456 family)